MKIRIIAPILLGGLALGYFGAAAIWPNKSRAEQIVELFHDYCLPPSSKELDAKIQRTLMPWKIWPGETVWVDPSSNAFLQRSDRRCSIQTLAPVALDRRQANELKARVDALVPQLFPELRFDPKATMGPETISTAWMQGAVASPERWGGYAFSYPDWGESAGSILSYTRPPKVK